MSFNLIKIGLFGLVWFDFLSLVGYLAQIFYVLVLNRLVFKKEMKNVGQAQ